MDAHRKRRRKIWACSECRRRKLQCDRAHPVCARCRKGGLAASCRYEGPQHEGLERQFSVFDARGEAVLAPLINYGQSATAFKDASIEIDIISEVAQLEQKLEALKARVGHGTALHVNFKNPDALSIVNHARIQSEHSQSAAFGVSAFRTTFHGETFPGTLAREITGLGDFTRDAFAKFSVLEDVRKEEAKVQQELLLTMAQYTRPSRQSLLGFFKGKEDTDQHVSRYFESFDHIYHIFDRHTFQEEYTKMWLNLEDADVPQIIIILLIMAIVKCSGAQGESLALRMQRRKEAVCMIETCEYWVQGAIQRYDGPLDFQIAFLILVARQLSLRWYKRTWVNAGNVIRTFMCAGLHRRLNASHHGTITLMEELRKRLWAAIAEFELQAAFEHGMCAVAWIHQGDVEPPLNIPDEKPSPGLAAQPVMEHTPTSYLSIAGQSLRFRHHLNTVLNDATPVISSERSKLYTDEIHGYLRAIPEGHNSVTRTNHALLSINLLQYLLALHAQRLQHSPSATERALSRIMLVESAARMVDLHQVAINCGSNVIEALYSDHVRIALSVCFAYVTMKIESDWMMLRLIEQHSFNILKDVIHLAGEKIKFLGGSRHQFWLSAAALGLMQSKREPQDRESHLRTSKDDFLRPYEHILGPRHMLESATSDPASNTRTTDGFSDASFVMQEPLDLSIDEWFNQWCSSSVGWPDEDWL